MRVRSILISIAMACGVVATAILSIERLWHLGLPGCGIGSGCAAAAESHFARIGTLPVAHPGFAYAMAMAIAWLASRFGTTVPLLWASRLGAIASTVFLVLIVEHEHWCGYCLAAHASNLTVWALLERSPRQPGRGWVLLVLAGAFGLVLGAIAVAKPQLDRRRYEERQLQMEVIVDTIVREETRGNGTKRWLPIEATHEGIRRGPIDARIRVTVFLDYQCYYCRTVAREVGALAELPGVSITWRQLPHGWPCNTKLKANLHDCACRCARLAIVASGTPEFARVHEWLLARNGVCSEEDIEDALPTWLGLEPATFWNRYHDVATRDAIRADLELAERLNLHATPAVFINGELLDSPNIGEAVRNIAERLRPTP